MGGPYSPIPLLYIAFILANSIHHDVLEHGPGDNQLDDLKEQ